MGFAVTFAPDPWSRPKRDTLTAEERAMIDAAIDRFAAEGRPIRVRDWASGHLPLHLYGQRLGRLCSYTIRDLARVRAAMVAGSSEIAEIAARTGLSAEAVARFRDLVVTVEGERP